RESGAKANPVMLVNGSSVSIRSGVADWQSNRCPFLRSTPIQTPSEEYDHSSVWSIGLNGRKGGGRFVADLRSNRLTDPSLQPLASQRPSADTSSVQSSPF